MASEKPKKPIGRPPERIVAGPSRTVVCAVPGCPTKRSEKGVSFHKIPTLDNRGRPDPNREPWLQACRITDAEGRGELRICSKHFRLTDYKPSSARLFPGAVPSLNLPEVVEQPPEVVLVPEDNDWEHLAGDLVDPLADDDEQQVADLEVVTVELTADDVLHDSDDVLLVETEVAPAPSQEAGPGTQSTTTYASQSTRAADSSEEEEGSDYEPPSDDPSDVESSGIESSDEDVSVDADKDETIERLQEKLAKYKAKYKSQKVSITLQQHIIFR